ncbi:MAG: carbonic anhydrase [Acidimicrobiia bacterium]|nr:carbonic anhydrase [Acidimicrobiia bacterium]
MSIIDRYLEANVRYAATFDQEDLAVRPAARLAVLTCMDSRVDPLRMLGLALGDAHVVRNAGGRASDDAIRSLLLSSRVLGTVEVAVIHHNDCGLEGQTDESLRERLATEHGVDASGVAFLPFGDLAESVREDVARIRSSPLLDMAVTGWTYDVRTGRLDRVV